MTEDEFAELSAGHALGALSPDDERAYREALAAHPEWQRVADRDAETAAALAEGAVPVAPPVDLRSRLLAAVAGTSEGAPGATGDAAEDAVDVAPVSAPVSPPPPTDVVQALQRRSWSRGLFALVASLALLVGIGWGVGAIATLWQTPPAVTALAEIEAAPDAASASTTFEGGDATVHWSESLGKVVLVADGLPQLPADRTFELWYVRGDAPVSAGTFSASGGAGTAQLSGPMEPGDTIAVTVEQVGGSPGGAPTTDPLFAIPTA